MYRNSIGLQHILLFLLSFSILSSTFSQETIRFRAEQASPVDDELYHEQFRSYTLASLSTETIDQLLRSKDYFSSLTLAYRDQKVEFSLIAHDLRSPDYKLQASTDAGVIEFPRSPNKTYYGFTKSGHYEVRITADDDCFYGLFSLGNDNIYIEPARNIIPGTPKGMFVIYKESDNLRKFDEHSCGVREAHTMATPPTHEELPQGSEGRSRACKVVQIALADDHLMFNKYGSVTDVEDHNMAVINNVHGNYDFEFNDDLQFLVVTIFVATSTGNDPFPTSTDPGVLLDGFRNWGQGGGFGVTFDESSLWSSRDFNGNVIGLAWLQGVCNSFKYNVLEDFTGNANFLRVLQAHEMGHNFGANHDADNSNTIMAPAVTNTNTWSGTSISVIDAYIAGVSCLASCSPPSPPIADFTANPTNGCSPLTVFFDDQSQNLPTSWAWSFPGGSPSSSTLQNPIVTYNNPGSFNVTLTATNAQGSNSKTITNYIMVSEPPFADFDYTTDENVVDFENLSEFGNTYLWNFGDGSTSTLLNPIHTYSEDGLYVVTLTTTNSCGVDVVMYTIEIITIPTADFDSDITEGCDPFEVQFFNYSSDNATDWSWSFPGGSPPTSTAYEPSIVYETPGTYAVTLIASNEAGQDVYSISNYIHVLPQPNATFTHSGSGLQITFNSTGSIGDDYLWNFGDGQTSTSANPSHTYASGGSYVVVLTVSNECGTDVFTQTISVAGSPVADFVADIETGCAPLVVHFTNTSAGNPTQFNWTFQGGSPASSTQANPTVTYNTPGLWDVILTVSNSSGSNTVTLEDFITINFATSSDFDFFINGLQATFTNQSTHSTSSTWLFGDGEQSTENNPVHVYNQDGTYTVLLISSGVCGPDTSSSQIVIQTPPQAGFVIQQSDFCAPSTVSFINQSSNNATSFAWSFEGGSPATSTLENPLVSYGNPGAYDVQLVAYGSGGTDTMTWNNLVNVGDIPDAAFLLSTNGTTVSLENQSTDADSYIWLFDDGNNSTEESPTHTYDNFGTYELTLIASNECGADTSIVVIELGNVPNAFFGYNVATGCAPFQVQFIDQTQNNPSTWSWSFEGGDPATSSLQNPIVTYAVPGSYNVSLSVQNGQGSDALALLDLIQVAGPPDATFNYQQFENTVPLEYLGTDYDSLQWSFGNGQNDNSLNPTAVYTADGQYQIQLIVFNACGTDTSSVLLNVEVSATNDPVLNHGNWQIRPNPFSDVLNLYGEPQQDGAMHVIMRDLAGRMISDTYITFGSGPVLKQIRSDMLASGLYLIELRTAKGSTVLKAVHGSE